VRKYDLANVTGEVGITTQYAIPLQTILSVAVYLNTLPSGVNRGETVDLNYTAISLTGRYTLIRDVLLLNGSIAPTFGNYRRTAADLGAEWFVRRNMSLQFQCAFFYNDGNSNDSIVSLRYRFTI
jgi:outer membrane translocation and assembly module TamA